MSESTTAFEAAPRPVIDEPQPWLFPATEERRLDNGVRVVTCNLPGRDVITARVMVASPLSAEPARVEGVATVLTDALTEGTRYRDGEQFSVDVERLGATVNAHAGYATIVITVTAVASRFDAAFSLAMEALTEPRLADRDVDRLRNTLLDGLLQQRANPASRAELEVFSALFDSRERFSRPLAGTEEGLRALTTADAQAFHAARIDPARTVLVLAGDLDRVGGGAGVLHAMSAWRTAGAADAVRATPPRTAGATAVHVVHRPGAAQTELRLARVGITRSDPDWPAIGVATYALGGSMTSRLMQVLREQKGYTYGVSARALSIGPVGLLTTGGAFETSVTGESVADTLRLVSELARDGVTDEETAFAIRNLGAAPRRMETSAAVVAVLSDPVADGLPADWCRHHFERLDAVTAAGASAAAARLWGEPLSIIAVGDADVVGPQLTANGIEHTVVAE